MNRAILNYYKGMKWIIWPSIYVNKTEKSEEKKNLTQKWYWQILKILQKWFLVKTETFTSAENFI